MLRRYSFSLFLLLLSCVNHDLSPEEDIDEPFVCDSTVSWENDILPIIQTSCAISGCHDGIARTNNWLNYAEVKENVATIRKKTVDRSMPFDRLLPQHQIDLIACWVDNGALQN